MEDMSRALVAIFSAIITLAIVSVIISKRSQAPQVIQAGASALSKVVRAAVDPVATAATNGTVSGTSFAPAAEQLPGFFEGLSNFPFFQ
jgi:hypothetical protein